MKIFVKETCEIPLYPEFKAGDTYEVDSKLAQILIDRGYAVEFDGSKEEEKKLRDFPLDKFKSDEVLENKYLNKEGKELKEEKKSIKKK